MRCPSRTACAMNSNSILKAFFYHRYEQHVNATGGQITSDNALTLTGTNLTAKGIAIKAARQHTHQQHGESAAAAI